MASTTALHLELLNSYANILKSNSLLNASIGSELMVILTERPMDFQMPSVSQIGLGQSESQSAVHRAPGHPVSQSL
jgi:hypothetical protein